MAIRFVSLKLIGDLEKSDAPDQGDKEDGTQPLLSGN